MRRPSHAFACGLAAAALTLACPSVTAATAWLCSLSEDLVQLICIADIDPLDEPVPAAQGAAAARTAVNGTRFPLDPALVYTVDLWSPPTELDTLELLARSTICYRSPGCTVTMAPQPWTVALRRLAGPAGRTVARR